MQNQFSSQQSHPNIQMGMLPNQILIYQQQPNQFLQNQMQIPQILAQDNIKAKNIYLRNIIEKNQINDIIKFVQENKQTSLIQNGILMTLQKYEKKNVLFYEILNIFLSTGIDVDLPIYYEKRPFIIEEKEKITLLMFGIMFNDIDLIKIIFKYNPNLNKVDSKKRNAIIYSIIYDNKDNPEIITLLIKKGADINTIINIEMAQNIFEEHSVFTLACFKGLINIVKVLLENNVNYKFLTQPNCDSGLHLAAQYNHVETAKILLNNTKGISEISNKKGFKPFDIARIKNNDVYKLFLNFYQSNNFTFDNNNNIFNNLNNLNNINEGNSNSSDYGETMEGTDKDTFTNSSILTQGINLNQNQINLSNYDINKNNMSNQNMFQIKNMNQLPIMNMNNNIIDNSNISNLNHQNEINDKKFERFTQKDLEYLKSKLSSSVLNKKIPYNRGLQIPIEFVKNNLSDNFDNSKEYNLNDFIKISKPPTLCLDLSDQSYELEIKLRKLNEELNEKIQKIKEYKEKVLESDEKIKQYETKLEEKNLELTILKNTKNENIQLINEYEKKKEELISKIPEDKIEKSNKNISPNKYREIKFQPEKYDENFIIKTLQKDLLDYEKYTKEKISKMKNIIDQLIQNIQISINEQSKDYEINIYGSYATDLSLPWSVLDLFLINKNPSINTHQNNQIFLAQLSYIFKNKPWVQSLKLIENPSIPKIKLNALTEFGNMNIDISIQEDKNNCLKYISLIKSYLKEYKVLQPIILALKTILKNANLNNPETGGLSSYGLILMVVSYIQSKSENNNYNENEEDIIGKIFYGFLGYYGINFDFNNYVILTYPIKNNTNNNLIDKDSSLNFGSNSHELIIVDPLNNQNNVAKNTFQFMNLKMAFMIAFMVTKEDCECGCHFGKANHEYSIFNIEHCILKRMFNSVKRFSDSK